MTMFILKWYWKQIQGQYNYLPEGGIISALIEACQHHRIKQLYFAGKEALQDLILELIQSEDTINLHQYQTCL